ncbi:MAG: tRNA pseudouridine(55) synthase TruB [Sphingobacteriia bacterium]|nr:tRNA pseudouridine(55) synthase TruB [Sphingobacteriia bacterium]
MNGFILLNKPKGLTSQQAVSRVKRILKIKKAGHAGTLDPFAEGLLPIAINEATRAMEYIFNNDKEYEFTIKFGAITDTLDLEGKIIEETNVIPSLESIKNVLPEFLSPLSQIPPKFSALKINGKRAYEMARNDVEFDLEPRNIEVYNLDIISAQHGEITLRTLVSKGTYVRSLARDIAIKAGSLGHVSYLKRTKFGKININKTITLDYLEKVYYDDPAYKFLYSIEEILDDIPVLQIGEEEFKRLSLGQKIMANQPLSETIYLLKYELHIVSIAKNIENYLQPIKNLRSF